MGMGMVPAKVKARIRHNILKSALIHNGQMLPHTHMHMHVHMHTQAKQDDPVFTPTTLHPPPPTLSVFAGIQGSCV